MVNVLAATADRLGDKGDTSPRTSPGSYCRRLGMITEHKGDPTDQPYRLSTLAERRAKVVGLDVSFVAATVRDVVETQGPV